MQNKENFKLILEQTLNSVKNSGERKKLLLHVCCAPCSSYVLEYLSVYFDITVFFYNPNISPKEEFSFREQELQRLLEEMPLSSAVKIIVSEYNSAEFDAIAAGHENLPEGGARCYRCYALRLEESAKLAKEKGFDYFCTTLSISPYKNAEWLNALGREFAEKYGVEYLISDFKKNNGYKRSCQLSEHYSLYRQDYCGCVYSKRDAEKRRADKKSFTQ